jgi:hypothetical protein
MGLSVGIALGKSAKPRVPSSRAAAAIPSSSIPFSFGTKSAPDPTAEWIAQQVTEACGGRARHQYLIRDRDRVYGEALYAL